MQYIQNTISAYNKIEIIKEKFHFHTKFLRYVHFILVACLNLGWPLLKCLLVTYVSTSCIAQHMSIL